MQLPILVRHSSYTLVLSCTVSEIMQVLLCSWLHPYSTPILGVFPLDQMALVGVSPSTSLKLFGRKLFSKKSNLCDHGRPIHIHVTARRTDRQPTVASPRSA